MAIPTKIFIVPYRDRISHKQHFDIYMKYILEDIPKQEYEIFFVHQKDNRSFNRGAMKNIGFLAMRNKYPHDYKNITFIFNDIDTMPATKNLLNYDTTLGVVKHFYGYKFALGGIFSIKGADFEKSGGFPNFWGWGLEDNCLYKRVLKANIQVDRNNFFCIADRNIIQIMDGLQKLLTKEDSWRLNITSDNLNDIKNLNYTIENEYIQVTNFITKYNAENEHYYVKHISIASNIVKDQKYNPHSKPVRQWKLY